MNPAPVVFNNTVLRDGHQSLAATRMTTAQMLPACADLDALGFGALETWGGATIDSCLRFLGENPFERLGTLKKAAPKTPHMMLLRGQNLVQYTSFPDDVVEAFVAATAARGLDIFRVFDALNDVRNLRTAIKAVKQAGKHAQGTICYTLSPVHTVASFLTLAEEIAANAAPVSTVLTRHMLWRMLGAEHPMAAHRIDSKGVFDLGRGADAYEGVVAFFEKRPASWTLSPSTDLPDWFPWWEEPSYEV